MQHFEIVRVTDCSFCKQLRPYRGYQKTQIHLKSDIDENIEHNLQLIDRNSAKTQSMPEYS